MAAITFLLPLETLDPSVTPTASTHRLIPTEPAVTCGSK